MSISSINNTYNTSLMMLQNNQTTSTAQTTASAKLVGIEDSVEISQEGKEMAKRAGKNPPPPPPKGEGKGGIEQAQDMMEETIVNEVSDAEKLAETMNTTQTSAIQAYMKMMV